MVAEYVNTFNLTYKKNPLGLRKSIKEGGSFSREEIVFWFHKNYQKLGKVQ